MDIAKIQAVAELRINLAEFKARRDRSLELWKAQNAELLSNIGLKEINLQEAETNLRSEAIEEFRATGNKAPGPGVAIKIFGRLEYDPEKAFEWACKHEMALQLNVKAFEKIVRISPDRAGDLSFVQVSQEPQAQIATDLSKALIESEKEK